MIGLGVIGTGDRAIGYLKDTFGKLREEEIAKVLGVADVNSVRVEEGRRDLAAEAGFTDYKQLLEIKGLDAVFVMTPDFTHTPIVTAALAAGKHVYCEKPMATTIEDCNAIVDAARNSKGIFFAGLSMRFGPTSPVTHRLIKEGRIGAVRMVWARRFVEGAKYWHRWHREKKNSGGLLVHKGCHYIDQMNWHSGSRPRYVSAFGNLDVYKSRKGAPRRCLECKNHCVHYVDIAGDERRSRYFLNAEKEDGYIRDLCVYAPGADVFDNAVVAVQYESGVRGTYMECHFAPITDMETEYGAVGDDGLILVSRRTADKKLEIRLEHAKTHAVEIVPPDTRMKSDAGAIMSFIECIEKGNLPENGYEAGWDSTAVGLAAQKSAGEMKTMEIMVNERRIRPV